MQKNFTNHDDFDKYVREQDKWILDNGWSNPELSIYMYRLEKSTEYDAGKLVEYLLMSRYANLTNHISVSHLKGKQSHEIWSGYIDSPNEYQVMMSAINKFIEEYKNNSGAT